MQFRFYGTNTQPWWDNEIEDKPNLNFNPENEYVWEELATTPNFLNNFSASIAIGVEKDYKYFMLKGENYNKYFFINNFSMKTNTIYVYELVVDIYMSYTQYFLNENKNKNFDILRHHRLTDERNNLYPNWQLEDDLIESIPMLKSKTNVLLEKSEIDYNINETTPPSFGSSLGQYFYVFNQYEPPEEGSIVENGYILLPLINDVSLADGLTAYNWNYNGKLYKHHNQPNFFKRMLNDTEWSNKFIGCFFITHWTRLDRTIKEYKLQGISGTYPLITCTIPVQGTPIGIRVPKNKIEELVRDNLPSSPDLSGKVIYNRYASKLFKFAYYNNYLDVNSMFDEDINWFINSVVGGQLYFGGNSIFTISPAYNREAIFTNIVSLPKDLPSTSNEYLKLVGATKSQVNSEIEHAKQNQIFGQVQNWVGTSQGMANSILNASPSGFVGSLTSGIFGAASQGLNYTQSKEMRASRYEDMKRTTLTNYSNSNDIDTSFLLTHYQGRIFHENWVMDENYKTYDVWYYNEWSEEYAKMVNNVFYYYGILYPLNKPLSHFFGNFVFNRSCYYLKFATNKLDSKVNWWSNFKKAENNLIIIQLSQGLRLWNGLPRSVYGD